MTTRPSSKGSATRVEDPNTPLDTVLHRNGFVLLDGLGEYGLFGLKRRVGDGLLASHLSCYAVDRMNGHVLVVLPDKQIWIGMPYDQLVHHHPMNMIDERFFAYCDMSDSKAFKAIVNVSRLRPKELILRAREQSH